MCRLLSRRPSRTGATVVVVVVVFVLFLLLLLLLFCCCCCCFCFVVVVVVVVVVCYCFVITTVRRNEINILDGADLEFQHDARCSINTGANPISNLSTLLLSLILITIKTFTWRRKSRLPCSKGCCKTYR